MPTTTRLIEHLPSCLTGIALRLERRMAELHLTQRQLAAVCNETRSQLFSEQDLRCVPKMTRDRIAKILMARRPTGGRSGAKALYPHELKLLAHALGVAVEWLAGPCADAAVIVWDPLTDPQRAEHLLHLIQHHEESATERVSWAEFLPCSFETPEFMHAHHAAIFGATDQLPETAPDAEAVVRLYDNVGNINRARTLAMARTRPWSHTHHMLLSDLTAIAAGTREYRSVSPDLRRAGLENLISLLSDRSMRLNLVVAEDSAVRDCKRRLRSFDSLFICGDTLAAWRDHSGSFYWSEHPRVVAAKRRLLEAFRNRARYCDTDDVLALLRQLRSVLDRDVRPQRLATLRSARATPTLKELAEVVLESKDLTAEQRADVLDLLEELGRQATLPKVRRSRVVTHALAGRMVASLSAAASLAPIWVAWGPLIKAVLGLEE